MKHIPSVDLAHFENAATKNDFVKQLGAAYEEIGFVAVKNHGLSDQEVEDIYTQVKAFFALDEQIKLKYQVPGLAGQRGYTAFGKEHAKGRNEGDLKEFWQFGQWEDPQGIYPANTSVDELPEFNSMGKHIYQKLENTGRKLLKAIALHLELPEDYFEEFVISGNSILRAIHYPPITHEPKNAVRAAEHEDINLITLLMGASAAGLEVLNKQGEWIGVTALPEQIIVNVGDMLQRLTNNKLKSTTHRVVNPPREEWANSRFSIPFFLHPISEMPLNCLETCINEENPRNYEDITAGEYLDERLREIGLKK